MFSVPMSGKGPCPKSALLNKPFAVPLHCEEMSTIRRLADHDCSASDDPAGQSAGTNLMPNGTSVNRFVLLHTNSPHPKAMHTTDLIGGTLQCVVIIFLLLLQSHGTA